MSRLGVLAVLLVVAALQLQAHGHDLSPNIKLVSKSNNTVVECTYSFLVQTGSVSASGTDAKITFDLNPANGSGFTFVIDSDGPEYETGSLDKFIVIHSCMKPCSLSLKINKEGVTPEWFPRYVYVEVSGKISAKQVFDVNQWIVPNAEPIVINYCKNGANAQAVEAA